MAYGEMYITEKFWPEFRRGDLYEALDVYMARERRFGKTSQQVAKMTGNQSNDSYFKRVVNVIKSK